MIEDFDRDLGTSVLVVAVYPDDEVHGCGGAIARHAEFGDQVQVLIVAEDSMLRQQKCHRARVRDELSSLAKAAQTAESILSAAGVELLDFPDNRLDSLDRLDFIKCIEECLERHQSECLYVHHARDVNVDHVRLHEAAVTASRLMPGHVVKRLLSFGVVNSTECQPQGSAPVFQPNWFVPISDQCERKRDALVAYSSEMSDWSHARSLDVIEPLARWRCVQVGVEAVEAFCLLQQLL